MTLNTVINFYIDYVMLNPAVFGVIEPVLGLIERFFIECRTAKITVVNQANYKAQRKNQGNQ